MKVRVLSNHWCELSPHLLMLISRVNNGKSLHYVLYIHNVLEGFMHPLLQIFK